MYRSLWEKEGGVPGCAWQRRWHLYWSWPGGKCASSAASWKGIRPCGKNVHEDLPWDSGRAVIQRWLASSLCPASAHSPSWIGNSAGDRAIEVWTEFCGNRRLLFNPIGIYLSVFLRRDPVKGLSLTRGSVKAVCCLPPQRVDCILQQFGLYCQHPLLSPCFFFMNLTLIP